MKDFIDVGGNAHGGVAEALLGTGFGVAGMRPWREPGKSRFNPGKSYVTINHKGKPRNVPTTNAALLRKQEWQLMDKTIMEAFKPRLKVVGLLRSQGLTYNIPNAMGITVFQSQTMSDITGATISMDGRRRGEADRPVFDLVNIPLPIIHQDFSFSAREIAVSRNRGTGIDLSTGKLAARRVAEEVEKLVVGTSASFQYGTGTDNSGTIYGMTNYTYRATKSMTIPTTSNQNVTVTEVLAMREQSKAMYHYGPWLLLTSSSWDPWLDADYSSAKGDNTLRDRIEAINGITGVVTADYLPANTMVMVQLTDDVIRMLMGMDVITVQWSTDGGMMLHFKVMCIMVPQLRADYNHNTGIVHGSHA